MCKSALASIIVLVANLKVLYDWLVIWIEVQKINKCINESSRMQQTLLMYLFNYVRLEISRQHDKLMHRQMVVVERAVGCYTLIGMLWIVVVLSFIWKNCCLSFTIRLDDSLIETCCLHDFSGDYKDTGMLTSVTTVESVSSAASCSHVLDTSSYYWT